MSIKHIIFDWVGESLIKDGVIKYVKIEHIHPELWFVTLVKYISRAPIFTHNLVYKAFYSKCF